MKKYLTLLHVSFLDSIVYRADFFLWGISTLIDTIIFLFLWITIYGQQQIIGGFNLAQTVTYLIGVGIISDFISVYVGQRIEKDVQNGGLNTYLIKPISYPIALLFSSIANKPINIVIRLLVYICVAFFFRDKFILTLDPLVWVTFLFSFVMAFIINFLINFSFGCISFWTTTSRGMFGILYTITAVFSGGYAPLTFFPQWFQAIASFTPFSYTRYFPMLIYLKQLSNAEIIKGIAIQIGWIVALLLVARFLWRRGVRRYEGVGI